MGVSVSAAGVVHPARGVVCGQLRAAGAPAGGRGAGAALGAARVSCAECDHILA